MDKVLHIYNDAGYTVKTIDCDNKFKSLIEEVKDGLDVVLNPATTQSHVLWEEQNNKTLKEAFWIQFHCTGYFTIPTLLIQYLVELNQILKIAPHHKLLSCLVVFVFYLMED